ncbi:uncharacterized protein LOC103574322 [Microplitis demolitor]|uniref:uncharacterized protein LOC103574322 n=1 Tax=Microplitis demolitor TaxID=69319 RepID=UPI0004CC99CA|nr:uncharacterized protein LOC103574322 [Microplitis demolitor]
MSGNNKNKNKNRGKRSTIESNKNRKLWDQQEKSILLRALKKYGYTDIDNIAKEFPYKSLAAVRTMINKLHLAAKKNSTVKKVQLDEWLNSGFFDSTDTMIPEAFKFISIFENHPTPEQSAGCDFRSLYDLLHRTTLGQPPVDITQMTVETLFYVLNKITHDIWPSCEKQVCEYVERLEQIRTRKVYSNSRVKSSNNLY